MFSGATVRCPSSPAASPCGWATTYPTRRKCSTPPPAALAQAGATMHMRTDVTSVDLDARTLTYRALDEAGDPAEQTLAFDKLVVTTGSRPVIPPIPGIDSPHVLL